MLILSLAMFSFNDVCLVHLQSCVYVPALGVCSVRFGRFCMCMANRNRIFRFVKFSTETDRNGWKTIGFGVFRFQSISVGFQLSKEKVIEIFKITLFQMIKQKPKHIKSHSKSIKTTSSKLFTQITLKQNHRSLEKKNS